MAETILEFQKNTVTFVYGQNNHGKTNLLEAIYLLGNLHSPRDAEYKEFINFNLKECIIGGDFSNQNINYRLYLKFNKEGKKFILLNNKPIKRIAAIVNILPIEYLSADNIRIFQERPDFRRKNLDRFIAKMQPDYLGIIKNYEKVVRQKNRLLKNYKSLGQANLEMWNQQLVNLAGMIIQKRLQILAELQEIMNALIGKLKLEFVKKFEIKYKFAGIEINDFSVLNYQKLMHEKLQNNAQKELEIGFSLYGAHRDDYAFLINEKELDVYFSKGINRIFALLLKIGQYQLYQREKKVFPILLLDDALAEIDENLKQKMIELIEAKTQIFYTTVLAEDAKLFKNVCAGKMEAGVLKHGK